MIPDSWDYSPMKSRIDVFRGASPRPQGDPRYYGGPIPRLMIQDVTRDGKITFPRIDSLTEEGAKKSRYLPSGSLVLSCSGTKVGIPGILGVDACIHDGFFGFRFDDRTDTEFLYYYFEYFHNQLQSSATKGGVFNNLTTDIMKNHMIPFPTVPEQQKIAEILSTWDKAIGLKEKLIEEKKQQKKGLMKKLLTGEVRLPGFELEWVEIELGEAIKEINVRTTESNQYPVLTSSRKGIFLQEEYFNKSVASFDNSGYKVIEKGQFTYRTMSDDGSFKFNQLTAHEIGIVSPAYVVFEAENIDEIYLKFLMDDYSFNEHIQKATQGGTRLSLKYNSLRKFIIKIPERYEQEAISKILSTIEREIELLETENNTIRNQKKGLMQLLLTGFIRVQC